MEGKKSIYSFKMEIQEVLKHIGSEVLHHLEIAGDWK